MNLIVAVDEVWAIGCNGDLLERIPEDLKWFKEKTLGKVVVTGRRTLETFPDKKPLKGRKNIILSRNENFKCEGAVICHSLEEFFKEIKKYQSEDIFVIGGEEIYNQLYAYCEYAYVTKIFKKYDADSFLVNFDELSNWILEKKSDVKNQDGLQFQFFTYKNLKALNNMNI